MFTENQTNTLVAEIPEDEPDIAPWDIRDWAIVKNTVRCG